MSIKNALLTDALGHRVTIDFTKNRGETWVIIKLYHSKPITQWWVSLPCLIKYMQDKAEAKGIKLVMEEEK